MIRRSFALTASVLVLLAGGSMTRVQAQWVGPGGYGGWGGYGYGGGWVGTAASSYEHGFADVVRSAGIANLYDSQAALNYEDARSKDLDNRLKATETYFNMRRMNDQYRQAERGTPATAEQLFRWAHRDVPRALNSYEFDPLTSQVNWPLVLRAPGYQDFRDYTEQFFRLRAESPQKVNIANLMRLQEVLENWLYTLKADIKAFKPNDYIRSRKFIESLAAEAEKT